jgi:hypothetical protein
VTITSATAQIADLLAWARLLSDTRHHIDGAERAAYQAAKTDLLTRIATANCHPREELT